MKSLCLLLLGMNTAVLVAAYMPNRPWAFDICRSAFGLCDYPVPVTLAAAACVGLFIVLKEIA